MRKLRESPVPRSGQRWLETETHFAMEVFMKFCLKLLALSAALTMTMVATAQMTDNTQATNTAKAGINKSLTDEIGSGRGTLSTPSSSVFIINRDPFRAIRRGRQLDRKSVV